MLAWIVLAPWAVWALMRHSGLDLDHPFAAAVAFTPYAAATSWVPAVVGVLLRRRAATALAVVVAVVLVGSVAPRALGGEQPDASGPRLTVMTSNLLYSRADADRVVQLVREHRVDVLSLQELTPAGLRALDRAGLRDVLPHRLAEPRVGADGSGLFARSRLTAYGPRDVTGAAQPKARLAGTGVVVQAVHPPPPIHRRWQADWEREIAELPAADGRPLRILAGDFNATLDHRELRRLLSRGYADAADRAGAGLVATWPSGPRRPPITIDHVLVDRRIAVEDVSVHDVRGSDHRAVIATIKLP